jgi:hypothetical protein
MNKTRSVKSCDTVLLKLLWRHSGRAVYLYSTAHKTQLTILQLEDFLRTSLFPNLLPQPIGGFFNNIFQG